MAGAWRAAPITAKLNQMGEEPPTPTISLIQSIKKIQLISLPRPSTKPTKLFISALPNELNEVLWFVAGNAARPLIKR